MKKFQALFAEPGNNAEADSVRLGQLASAALMLEVARADFDASEEERNMVASHLRSAFSLSDEEIGMLQQEADERVDASTSLYEFTRVINDSCSPEERVSLIEQMWQVAFADGELCRYEEHLIRRVADLVYVSHSDFIRTKHRVAGATHLAR